MHASDLSSLTFPQSPPSCLQFAFSFPQPEVLGGVNVTGCPTAGGQLASVFGSGFGDPSWAIAVLIGGAPATVLSHSDTQILLLVPTGSGVDVPVTVFTPYGGASPAFPLFDFAPPDISAVTLPNGAPVIGGFPVQIQGQVSISFVLVILHVLCFSCDSLLSFRAVSYSEPIRRCDGDHRQSVMFKPSAWK